jgi:hypothetical protein
LSHFGSSGDLEVPIGIHVKIPPRKLRKLNLRIVSLRRCSQLVCALIYLLPQIALARYEAIPVTVQGKTAKVLWEISPNSKTPSTLMVVTEAGTEIQIDNDGDGIVDIEKVLAPNFEIEKTVPRAGKFELMKIIRYTRDSRMELSFHLSKNRKQYDLWSITQKPYQAYSNTDQLGSELGPSNGNCGPAINDGKANSTTIKTAADIQDKTEKSANAELLDRTCGAQKEKLTSALTKILKDQGTDQKYFACIDQLHQLEGRGKLITAQLRAKLEQYKSPPTFICQDPKDKNWNAQFLDSQKVLVNNRIFSKTRSDAVLESILFHELVHSIISDETLTLDITKCCSKGFDPTLVACADAQARLSKNEHLPEAIEKLEKNEHTDGLRALALEKNLKTNFSQQTVETCNENWTSEGCRKQIVNDYDDLISTFKANCSANLSAEKCASTSAALEEKKLDVVNSCALQDHSSCLFRAEGGSIPPTTITPNVLMIPAAGILKQSADELQKSDFDQADSATQMLFKPGQPDQMKDAERFAEERKPVIQKTAESAREATSSVMNNLLHTATASTSGISRTARKTTSNPPANPASQERMLGPQIGPPLEAKVAASASVQSEVPVKITSQVASVDTEGRPILTVDMNVAGKNVRARMTFSLDSNQAGSPSAHLTVDDQQQSSKRGSNTNRVDTKDKSTKLQIGDETNNFPVVGSPGKEAQNRLVASTKPTLANITGPSAAASTQSNATKLISTKANSTKANSTRGSAYPIPNKNSNLTTPDESLKFKNVPVRSAADIAKMLQAANNPRLLLDRAWFVAHLEKFGVEIVDGQRIIPDPKKPRQKVTKTRWNIRAFTKEEKP